MVALYTGYPPSHGHPHPSSSSTSTPRSITRCRDSSSLPPSAMDPSGPRRPKSNHGLQAWTDPCTPSPSPLPCTAVRHSVPNRAPGHRMRPLQGQVPAQLRCVRSRKNSFKVQPSAKRCESSTNVGHPGMFSMLRKGRGWRPQVSRRTDSPCSHGCPSLSTFTVLACARSGPQSVRNRAYCARRERLTLHIVDKCRVYPTSASLNHPMLTPDHSYTIPPRVIAQVICCLHPRRPMHMQINPRGRGVWVQSSANPSLPRLEPRDTGFSESLQGLETHA